MSKPLRCWLGFHRWMDLQRRDETLGQNATEECVLCGKSRDVFRLFHGKDGPMHPRVAGNR